VTNDRYFSVIKSEHSAELNLPATAAQINIYFSLKEHLPHKPSGVAFWSPFSENRGTMGTVHARCCHWLFISATFTAQVKWNRALHTTRDIPKGVRKPSVNETEQKRTMVKTQKLTMFI